MFTPGLWRHEKFMDVVLETFHGTDIVRWWNLSWVGKPYVAEYGNLNLNTKVKSEDFSRWEKLDALPIRVVS